MNKKFYSVQCLFLAIIGIILLILSVTTKDRLAWLDHAKNLYWVLAILVQLEWFVIEKKKKVENMDDQAKKKLLNENKKEDAITKVMKDSKCGILDATIYVGELEKTI